MPAQYSHRQFFRRVPNKLLAQYFRKKKVDLGIDFNEIGERDADRLFEAFSGLDDKQQASIEADFQDIHAMACEGGVAALNDEATYHEDEKFTKTLAGREGFYDKVMWAYLKKNKYWRGASMFLHADNVSPSYWKKRNDLPSIPPSVEDNDIEALAESISQFFYSKEGRGRNCKVRK